MKKKNPLAIPMSELIHWPDATPAKKDRATREAERSSKPGYSEYLKAMDDVLQALAQSKGTASDILRLQEMARAGNSTSDLEI